MLDPGPDQNCKASAGALPITGHNSNLQKLTPRPSNWLVFFDLIVVIALAIFPCIYDIAGNSYGEGDQTTHAKVTQEMLHTGNWLFPTNKGHPYINKPPFKMWLGAIPVKLLGESTFSYRILDGVIGILTIAAIFLFASTLFRSRLAGYLAALAQLGCSGWFFGHGIRESVQDGMMIFLVTLAMICGYYFVELVVQRLPEFRSEKDSRRLIQLAALGGIFTGLGLMTKSAAALIAPITIGVWVVSTWRLGTVIKNGWREIVLAVTAMVLIPAMFFVPYFIARPRAMWMVFNTEVFKRATKGYHNTRQPFFYYNILIKDRSGIAPELLVAALLIALYFLIRRRDHRYSFLICWSIVPVLVYSAAKSKLAWYINPAFIGMSILAGAITAIALAYFWNGVRSWSFSSAREKLSAGAAGIFALAALILLGWHAESVSARVYQPKRRSPTDLIVSQIQANRKAGWPNGRIVAYNYGKLNNNERLYFDMIGVEYISDPLQFVRAIDDPNLAFVITKGNQFSDIAPLRPFDSYAYLPPKFIRRRWAAVIAYRDEPLAPPFKPAAWGENFADYDFAEGFGLENTSVSGNRAVRRSFGARSSLTVTGDMASATFGLIVRLRYAPLAPVTVDVFANTFKIAELKPEGSDFQTGQFRWPRDRIERGTNLLTFQYRLADGSEPQVEDHAVSFESIEFEVDQPQLPVHRTGTSPHPVKKDQSADGSADDGADDGAAGDSVAGDNAANAEQLNAEEDPQEQADPGGEKED